jgi:hypothetical protein
LTQIDVDHTTEIGRDFVSNAAVISKLRSARNAQDTISLLRASSLEARAERIAEALNDPTWAAGPAQLIATYAHHALCEKNGILMRVKLIEDKDEVQLGAVEVHDIPESINDVGAEVMETAKVAVDHILAEDYESATPLIASIANALNYKGALQQRIQTEVAKRSIQRAAWWHDVVREHLGDDARVEIPAPHADVTESIATLRARLVEAAQHAAVAINALGDDDDVSAVIEDAAKDIAADLKYAIQALSGVDKDNLDEMNGIYEGVAQMSGYLMLGVKFLGSLVQSESIDENTEESA